MDNVRIGIIGTGRIATRFVKEAQKVDGIQLTVSCNPNIENARRFAEINSIPQYTDHMEKLAEEVDAVYIATPHAKHYTYAKRMLDIGKHVLCEKPMTLSKSQAEELFALARQKNCVLMEAVKTDYCPGFQAMMEMARSGKIGEIVDVEAAFTRLTPINVREYQNAESGGSFTELGTYTLLPILTLFGTEYEDIGFFSRYFDTGVDIYTKVYLSYGDKTATCKTGIGAKSEGQLLITGTRGYILAPSPWWLTKKFQVRFEDPNRIEEYEYPFEAAGMTYEIEAFRDKIIEGRPVNMLEARKNIVMAEIMEKFLTWRAQKRLVKDIPRLSEEAKKKVKIWAHRGCSRFYPENTLESFEAAAKLSGLTGVELDVQLTKDGELVVIHDESVERTTDGKGKVIDYTLKELKKLKIAFGDTTTTIPTFREVLTLLAPYCKEKGLLINVELKTSVERYPGIEEKVLEMVREFGISEYIVYSSFLMESIALIKKLDETAKTGMLETDLDDCIEGMEQAGADAVHPYIGGLRHKMPEKYADMPVRAWNGEEELYGMNRPYKELDLREYALYGATEIFTNEPEKYLPR